MPFSLATQDFGGPVSAPQKGGKQINEYHLPCNCLLLGIFFFLHRLLVKTMLIHDWIEKMDQVLVTGAIDICYSHPLNRNGPLAHVLVRDARSKPGRKISHVSMLNQ